MFRLIDDLEADFDMIMIIVSIGFGISLYIQMRPLNVTNREEQSQSALLFRSRYWNNVKPNLIPLLTSPSAMSW